MSATSSDTWILIALTILVVLVLFYLSKKMICYGHYEGEESATASSSTSSTSASASYSNSPSFSDYYSSPFDPGEVSSPASTDDYHAITIPIDDGGFGQQENIANELRHNNNHSFNNGDDINNANLRGTTDTSNVRGGGPVSVLGERFYREARPPTISIISSEDMDRKTMLEGQLRNQITKIVHAEREVQRLVQLLAIEQGMDALTTASLRHDMRSAAAVLHHQPEIPSVASSGRLGRSTLSSCSGNCTQGSEEATLGATVERPMLPFRHNDIPSLSHFTEISSHPSTPRPLLPVNDHDVGDEEDDDDDDASHHHQNNAEERRPRENRHQQNESYPSPQNTDRVPTSASGNDQRSQFLPRGLYHHCPCNLCSSSNTNIGRIRRMLLLRQMLLPISFQVGNDTLHTTNTTTTNSYGTEVTTATGTRSLSTPVPPLTSCLHYSRNGDPDLPPTYEECMLRSTYNNNNNRD